MAKSQKNAAKGAVIEVKGSTIAESVAKFTGTLKGEGQRKAVLHAVEHISKSQSQMVQNAMAIGEQLNTLREEIGLESFGQFMGTVLPKLGISRSTGYRWAAIAAQSAGYFPSPLVRLNLMSLTNGQGIIVQDDKGRWGLAAAYQQALKKVGPAPKDNDAEKTEKYVAELMATARKFRTAARTGTKGSAEGLKRAEIVKKFSAFAKQFGLKAAEDLIGRIDKVFTALTQAVADKKAAESIVARGTGSKAVAHKTAQTA